MCIHHIRDIHFSTRLLPLDPRNHHHRLYIDDLPALRRWGLEPLTQHLLGSPLSKDERISDWEANQLTDEQIIYAGADAVAAVVLYRSLENLSILDASPSNTIFWNAAADRTDGRRIELNPMRKTKKIQQKAVIGGPVNDGITNGLPTPSQQCSALSGVCASESCATSTKSIIMAATEEYSMMTDISLSSDAPLTQTYVWSSRKTPSLSDSDEPIPSTRPSHHPPACLDCKEVPRVRESGS